MLRSEVRKTALVMEECEEQRAKADDLQEKIMELTRQKRKLTELYNNLKTRHQELVNKVGNNQEQTGDPLQIIAGRITSSRGTPMSETHQQPVNQVAKVIIGPAPTITGLSPGKCLFPRSTPAVAKKIESGSTPMKRPPYLTSSKGCVVLNVSAVQKQQKQLTSSASL